MSSYGIAVYGNRVHRDDVMFRSSEGPLAVVRSCLYCKHYELVRKGLRGAGRGYGMREGNKARGRMIQHVKKAHPQELADAIAKHVALGRVVK